VASVLIIAIVLLLIIGLNVGFKVNNVDRQPDGVYLVIGTQRSILGDRLQFFTSGKYRHRWLRYEGKHLVAETRPHVLIKLEEAIKEAA
jgi:hypothetical protein